MTSWGSTVTICALLVGCASSSAATDAVATTSPADVEIAPVQPSSPSTATAAVIATAAPPPESLCDQYWVRLRSCMERTLKDVDPQARETAMKAMGDAEQQTREAFGQLDETALEAACRAMVDALAQNPICPEGA